MTPRQRHLKDKKVTLLQITSVKDDDGYDIEKLIPMPKGENIWAYFRHASGSEFYGAATNNVKIEVIFEINWRKDIDPRITTVRYKEKDYRITRIDNFEDYKIDLRIYAYKVN